MAAPLQYIPVEDALARIHLAVRRLPSERILLSHAHLRVLAADVRCPIDHPLFDQSAVDGYALRHADLARHSRFQVVAEIRAGSPSKQPIHAGECARIFTGAPLPPGSDTIVMQEHVRRTGDFIEIETGQPAPGAHVRYAGDQIRAGEIALQAGTPLSPAAIGFLASLGILEVEVHRLPRIAILVTGDEFAKSAEDLRHGLIFESNGAMLRSALQQLGLKAEVYAVPEDRAALHAHIATCLPDTDLFIATGGVSVGDHDHTRAAFEDAGFEVDFHQVQQKPGKPLLFAHTPACAAFGLPGNPRAVLVCYYVYVLPWLMGAMGAATLGLKRIKLPLTRAWRRKPDGKSHLVTARIEGPGMYIDEGQNSHMLRSFTQADLIVVVPPEGDTFEAGAMLDAYLLA